MTQAVQRTYGAKEEIVYAPQVSEQHSGLFWQSTLPSTSGHSESLLSTVYRLSEMSNNLARSPDTLDTWFITSREGPYSLLIPEGYKQAREVSVRVRKIEDGTWLATTRASRMYGHGDSMESAFEDFRNSLASYFLRLVRDKDILGVLLQKGLEKLSKVFVKKDT